MATDVDRENLSKALQSAGFLSCDLRVLAESRDPFLAELALRLLRSAGDIERKLSRPLALAGGPSGTS
ncbi:MAG: hypothetical protein DI596_00410 [Azospira oryzae]|nr:MAG: hypothetical protein DI596_00410 [Azospira oryzae]PZP82994.1 MAG: hypothetical protein DI593_00410 [Azospira oryzae]